MAKMRFRDWIAATIPIALLLVIFLTNPIASWAGWTDSNKASWAQAMLSGLAVLAAVGAVWWQIAHAQRESRADIARKLEILASSIFFLRVQALNLSHLAESSASDETQFTAFKTGIQSLAALPLYESPSARAATRIARIVASFSGVAAQWTTVHVASGPNKPKIASLAGFVHQLMEAEEVLRDESKRLGFPMITITAQLSNGGYTFFADRSGFATIWSMSPSP